MDRFTDNFVFAIKDKDGYFFVDFKKWDKQICNAKLYHNYKHAKEMRDDIRLRFSDKRAFVVQLRIIEIGEFDDGVKNV